MTVSDSSPYWVVDEMLWGALEDTTLTYGNNLDLWRKQQNPAGNAGLNFREGQLPEELPAHHTPALAIRTSALETPEEYRTKAAMSRLYQVDIIGVLNIPAHRELEGDKLIKRYQHLVEGTLGEALRDLQMLNSAYLPAGETNPIVDIIPGDPIFPNWMEPGTVAGFVWPVTVLIDVGNLWIS